MGVPQISADGVALLASPLDLLGTKLKVLLGHGLALAEGLGAAKALVDFADGDLAELGLSERRQREQAVLAEYAIPSVERIGEQLVPFANLS